MDTTNISNRVSPATNIKLGFLLTTKGNNLKTQKCVNLTFCKVEIWQLTVKVSRSIQINTGLFYLQADTDLNRIRKR